jgi:hypothetical protein
MKDSVFALLGFEQVESLHDELCLDISHLTGQMSWSRHGDPGLGAPGARPTRGTASSSRAPGRAFQGRERELSGARQLLRGGGVVRKVEPAAGCPDAIHR